MKVIQPLILVLIVLSGNLSYSQNKEDLIVWGERQIEWTDFKSAPDNSTKHEASTYSSISHSCYFGNDTLSITILAEFNPNKSWKKANLSDHLLIHERMHFDITEYHTRLFRKEFSKYIFTSFDSIQAGISKMLNKHYNNWMIMQEQYDLETGHSQDHEQQEIWNKKVALLLKQTEKYSSVGRTKYIGHLK